MQEISQAITTDWVHTTLSDGIFGTEVLAFLRASERILDRGGFEEVNSFLMNKAWQYPKYWRSSMGGLHYVFNTFRSGYAQEHNKLKAMASELLSAYGMLRHWITAELPDHPDLRKHMQSFLACCDCLDIIVATKNGRMTLAQGGAKLSSAAGQHLELHKSVYGTELLKPKHHWIFDVAAQWSKRPNEDDLVVDAFVVEKLHLRIKPFAERTDNTSQFELSVHAGQLNNQVELLGRLGSGSQLLGACTATLPGFLLAHFSNSMIVNSTTICLKDVVMCDQGIGEVIMCVLENNEFMVLANRLRSLETVSTHSARYSFDGTRAVWTVNATMKLANTCNFQLVVAYRI